ncbi:MAG TPA: hypothetical protein VGS20_04765 [Candidatus Acidoferrales bacterium]|nr:hypothetical protein [Candidatus Acidoferrales bacterium]
MEPNQSSAKFRTSWIRVSVIAAFALAICFGGLPLWAGQQQAGQSEQAPPPTQIVPDQALPPTLTLPAGTVLPVRVMEWLSSKQSRPGDSFSAMLDQPLVANGWVVSRRGQYLFGRVVVAQKAGHGKHSSELGVDLNELTLVDGQAVPIQTQLLQSSGPGSTGRDVMLLVASTILGAAIGGAAGDGTGAVIGAATGATAGGIAVLETPGHQTVISPETLLTFRLVAPLAISTDQGRVAFQPVTQQDYNPAPGLSRRPLPGYPAYPPPPLYYPYYYCPFCVGWAYYPAPYYFGFYGYYRSGRGYGRFGRFDRDDSRRGHFRR